MHVKSEIIVTLFQMNIRVDFSSFTLTFSVLHKVDEAFQGCFEVNFCPTLESFRMKLRNFLANLRDALKASFSEKLISDEVPRYLDILSNDTGEFLI